MARKNQAWLDWLKKIGEGALNGAMDNEHAQDGVNNMVGSVLKKYKGYLIAGGVLIGTLILVTIAGLFKSNRNNYRK